MSEAQAKTARAEWGTRFGFLMAIMGAMVGVGNIRRFPYIAGQNGGDAFIIAFLVLLFRRYNECVATLREMDRHFYDWSDEGIASLERIDDRESSSGV